MVDFEAPQLREQLAATREILRAIGRMPKQTETLCELILNSAHRLAGCQHGVVALHEGQRWFRAMAMTGVDRNVARHWLGAHYQVPASLMREAGPWRPLQMSHAQLRGSVPALPPIFEFFVTQVQWQWGLFVPLLAGDEMVGSFVITKTDVKPFSDEQIELVQSFADHAVVALQNARALAALDRQNALQSANAEILRAIGCTPDQPEAICELILERAMALAGTRMGHVLLYEGGRMFRTIAVAGPPDEDEAFWRGRSYHGNESLFRERGPWRPLHVPDLDAAPVALRDDPVLMSTYQRAGVRAFLYIPLVAGDRIVGAFGVSKSTVGPFTSEQIDILQSFADHAVVAIDNAGVLKALARQNALQSANAEILQAISNSRSDAAPIFDIILRKTVEFTQTDVAGLGLHEGEGRMLFVGGIPVDWRDAVVGMAYRFDPGLVRQDDRWITHYMPDLAVMTRDRRRQPMEEFLLAKGIRSVLSIPLVAQGRLIGVFHACSKEVRTFSDEQIALVGTFASQAVIALENTRIFHEIELKNEQLEQASRHKSEFLANMSHELRTPLNAIIGFSEALKDELFGPLNEKQAEYTRDIHGAGHHLLTLINDVLDLAKVEAGRMELMVEPFDLPAAIDSALIMVRERANRHGVALEARVDAGLGRFVGDERKFKQVLLNLLSNAVKFSPNGGRIEVRAQPTHDGVQVSVADQGIGIPEDQQRQIFEAFHQAESTLAVKREGTGLGLTLARRFVELHGGIISVHSRPEEGSTFTFSMTSQPWPEA